MTESVAFHELPPKVVDIGFLVSVNEVPAHLADLVKAYVGMQLDAMTSELLAGMEETGVSVHGLAVEDLSDDDLDAILHLRTNVSEVLA